MQDACSTQHTFATSSQKEVSEAPRRADAAAPFASKTSPGNGAETASQAVAAQAAQQQLACATAAASGGAAGLLLDVLTEAAAAAGQHESGNIWKTAAEVLRGGALLQRAQRPPARAPSAVSMLDLDGAGGGGNTAQAAQGQVWPLAGAAHHVRLSSVLCLERAPSACRLYNFASGYVNAWCPACTRIAHIALAAYSRARCCQPHCARMPLRRNLQCRVEVSLPLNVCPGAEAGSHDRRAALVCACGAPAATCRRLPTHAHHPGRSVAIPRDLWPERRRRRAARRRAHRGGLHAVGDTRVVPCLGAPGGKAGSRGLEEAFRCGRRCAAHGVRSPNDWRHFRSSIWCAHHGFKNLTRAKGQSHAAGARCTIDTACAPHGRSSSSSGGFV